MEIAARHAGFPGLALGAYAGGLLAAELGPSVQVRFRRPIPVDVPLVLARSTEVATLALGDVVVAEARPSHVAVGEAPVVSVEAAREAGDRYIGHERHPYPSCFCCGPARGSGDGLRVFVGPVHGGRAVAGLWTAPRAFADARGRLPLEIAWSVIDCPGIWALIVDAPEDSDEQVVTGTLDVRVDHPLRSDTPYVVTAWPLGREGRRLYVGTTVSDDSGEVAVTAMQTCVASRPGVPLGLSTWRST